jgi:hypothetical protein
LDDVVRHVWPEQPRDATPTDLALAFAVEVLGWEEENTGASEGSEADPSGPVWVRLGTRVGFVEPTDVLTIPTSDGGRVIAEVTTAPTGPQVPSLSVFPLPGQGSGSSVGLNRITEAAVAAEGNL